MDGETIIIESALHPDPGGPSATNIILHLHFFNFLDFSYLRLTRPVFIMLLQVFMQFFMSTEPPVDPKTVQNMRGELRNDVGFFDILEGFGHQI